ALLCGRRPARRAGVRPAPGLPGDPPWVVLWLGGGGGGGPGPGPGRPVGGGGWGGGVGWGTGGAAGGGAGSSASSSSPASASDAGARQRTALSVAVRVSIRRFMGPPSFVGGNCSSPDPRYGRLPAPQDGSALKRKPGARGPASGG